VVGGEVSEYRSIFHKPHKKRGTALDFQDPHSLSINFGDHPGEIVPWNFTGQAGWAQINGRDDIPIPKKVEYDEYYLNHRSFLFDLKILFLTFLKVTRAENVSH